MKPLVPSTYLLDRQRAGHRLAAARAGSDADTDESTYPDFVLDRLAEMTLLHGVPFEYLVPDARLLPEESIRFFRLDPDWTSALHEGVLSVGQQSSADTIARRSRGEPLVAGRLAAVRDRRRGRQVDTSAAARASRERASESGIVTGFLLRSTLVTNYPGLQVRAYDSTDPAAPPLQIFRLDRPAYGVLFALFDGLIAAVEIEEPHHGIRLGVDETASGTIVQLRGTDGNLVKPGGSPASVPVPFRSGGAAGVIDFQELMRRISQSGVPGVPSGTTSSMLALQLIQTPVCQRFERRTS